MLTEIASPETMPKNNRKMPKGQRFLVGALGIGHWHREEDLGTRRIGDKEKDLFQVLTSCPLFSPTSPAIAPILLITDHEVNFVTMGRSVLQGLAPRQYLGRK
jgi:hypothetical protein